MPARHRPSLVRSKAKEKHALTHLEQLADSEGHGVFSRAQLEATVAKLQQPVPPVIREPSRCRELTELELLPPLAPGEAGPVGQPYPGTLTATVDGTELKAHEVVDFAHVAWSDVRPDYYLGQGWKDAATLAYTVWALQHAHENPRLKNIALRLVSRAATPQNPSPLNATEEEAEVTFAALHKASKALSDALGPTLMEYRRQNDLCATLGHIKVEGSAGHLTQKGRLAFFDEAFAEEIYEKGWSDEADSEAFQKSCVLAILVNLVCHYIGEEFERRVGLLARDSKSVLKAAPHKSWQRMRTKAFDDGAYYVGDEYAHPKVQYVKDPLRASLAASDVAAQLKDWEALQESDDFRVVGLKN
eukprot:2517512-Prymnesium_polylepis.1